MHFRQSMNYKSTTSVKYLYIFFSRDKAVHVCLIAPDMQTGHRGSFPESYQQKAELTTGRVSVQSTQVHRSGRAGLSRGEGKGSVLRQTLPSPAAETGGVRVAEARQLRVK